MCVLLLLTGAPIGRGAFGEVFRGTYGGRPVAVKAIQHLPKHADKVANEVRAVLFALGMPSLLYPTCNMNADSPVSRLVADDSPLI